MENNDKVIEYQKALRECLLDTVGLGDNICNGKAWRLHSIISIIEKHKNKYPEINEDEALDRLINICHNNMPRAW